MKMDIVIDIHDGVVLEPCPCCGSPAQPLRVENALEVFYVIACSNTQAPTDPHADKCPLRIGTSRSRYEKLTFLEACARWNVFSKYQEHKRQQNAHVRGSQ